MKYTSVVSSALAIGLVGCGGQPASRRPTDYPGARDARVSTEAGATVILSPAEHPDGLRTRVYEDDEYVFWTRGFGPKGQYVPGVFVFAKKAQKWMRIDRVSTKNARLGRSPTLEEAICSVAWDYTGLRTKEYAVLPLTAFGGPNLPDKIVYYRGPQEYHLLHNWGWGIPAVLTELVFKKGDLDAAFAAADRKPDGQ